MSKVSIIIPHFNRSFLLNETIQSIIDQSYTDWEIIIVDDKSEEGEWENLQMLATDKIRIFRRDREPKGPSTCRNIGVEKAKGNYVIFVDSDDLLAPFCLEQRIAYMHFNSEVKMAVFNMLEFYEVAGDSVLVFNKTFEDNDATLRNFLRLNIPWQLTAAIWKKEFFHMIGGFNEQMQYAEDPELHARAFLCASSYIKIISNHKADAYYRMPSELHKSTAGNIMESIYGRMKFIKSLHQIISNLSELNLQQKNSYLKDLGIGYKNIVSLFFNHSKIHIQEEFGRFQEFCFENKIISRQQRTISSFVVKMWEKDSPISKLLHIKGICTRLYLQKL